MVICDFCERSFVDENNGRAFGTRWFCHLCVRYVEAKLVVNAHEYEFSEEFGFVHVVDERGELWPIFKRRMPPRK